MSLLSLTPALAAALEPARLHGELVLDGRLDEAAWDAPEPITERRTARSSTGRSCIARSSRRT